MTIVTMGRAAIRDMWLRYIALRPFPDTVTPRGFTKAERIRRSGTHLRQLGNRPLPPETPDPSYGQHVIVKIPDAYGNANELTEGVIDGESRDGKCWWLRRDDAKGRFHFHKDFCTPLPPKTSSTMTPSSIRIACAEECGYRKLSQPRVFNFMWAPGHTSRREGDWEDKHGNVISEDLLPNFPVDANAALSLVTLLAKEGWFCILRIQEYGHAGV